MDKLNLVDITVYMRNKMYIPLNLFILKVQFIIILI